MELAIGLLVAGMVTVVAVWVVNLVIVQTRCGDVAAQVARQVARGDEQQARAARQRAPRGAAVDVARTGSQVSVTVQVDQSLGRLGPVHLRARAVADLEPGVPGARG